jgi:ABC-2 type transport system ATP-binding protein
VAASSGASEPVAKIEGIWKRYDRRVAVENLSFEVRPGQVVGLLGPNGAGKTSTLRMIVNILRPDEGRILIGGRASDEETKRLIGYLPEERGLYKKMKIREVVEFFGRLRGLSAPESRERTREWLQRIEMADRAEDPVQSLSKGLQQKVQFAATLIHRPKLLILDEVFSGLDPVNVKKTRDELQRLRAEGMAIIFSTHVLEQAERLCDYVVMLKEGKARIQGTAAEVKARYGTDWFMVGTGKPDDHGKVMNAPQVGRRRRDGHPHEGPLQAGRLRERFPPPPLGPRRRANPLRADGPLVAGHLYRTHRRPEDAVPGKRPRRRGRVSAGRVGSLVFGFWFEVASG